MVPHLKHTCEHPLIIGGLLDPSLFFVISTTLGSVFLLLEVHLHIALWYEALLVYINCFVAIIHF